MTKEELSNAIYREICAIPCRNSGIISPDSVLSQELSTNLIKKISDKAAEVALRESN